MEHTEGMVILVHDREVAGALKNLQRRRKIRRTGNTGLITLAGWIRSRAISVIFVALLQRFRFVRDLRIRRINEAEVSAVGDTPAPRRKFVTVDEMLAVLN